MKKLCMIMADPDVSYMESVSAYIRVSRHWDEFDLKLFSSSERLLDFLETRSSYDILLISNRFLSSLDNGHQEDAIVLLEENEPLQFSPAQQTLFKYQPLDQLLSSIVSIYRSSFKKAAFQENEKSKTKVISVFSGSGGSGKTTFAINLSRQMAKEHRKVFYLNLELSHSTPLFLSSSEPHQSSQILYYVKTHPEQAQSKIESLKKFDPQAKVDFFDFMVSPQEMTDLTGQETEILISAIAETNYYDALIIDLESSLNERIKAVLKKARIFFG